MTSILCLCKFDRPTFQFCCSDLCYRWAKCIINVFSSCSFAYIYYSSIFNKMLCFLRWRRDHIPTPSTTLLSWVFSFCSCPESWDWRCAPRWKPTFILQYFSIWVRFSLWTGSVETLNLSGLCLSSGQVSFMLWYRCSHQGGVSILLTWCQNYRLNIHRTFQETLASTLVKNYKRAYARFMWSLLQASVCACSRTGSQNAGPPVS